MWIEGESVILLVVVGDIVEVEVVGMSMDRILSFE